MALESDSITLDASLQATCPRRDILDAVQSVSHAVSGRSTLPILTHVLIRSDRDGLMFLGTDLELSISRRIPAAVVEAGALTAPARVLSDVLANLGDKTDVALSVDRSHTARVNSNRSDYKIHGLAPDDYPDFPEVPDSTCFTIASNRLRELIRKTQFAASSDEARAILTGVLVSFTGDGVTFVATDTHRLAMCSADVSDGKGAHDGIVPVRAMNELARLLPDTDKPVAVSVTDKHIRFGIEEADTVLISALIEGQYPNYKRVIPESYSRKITVHVEPLRRAVRAVSVVARENLDRIVFQADANQLLLTAEARTVGNASEEVEILHEGEPSKIAFNANYLLDVLGAVDADVVDIEMTEPLKPAVVRPHPADGEAGTVPPPYLCVLMPMQVV